MWVITTAPVLDRFFLEVGQAVTPGVPVPSPTTEELERFARVATRYRHWLASPEENAVAGIHVPG